MLRAMRCDMLFTNVTNIVPEHCSKSRRKKVTQTPHVQQETHRHFTLVVFEPKDTPAGRFFAWPGCDAGRCEVVVVFGLPAPGLLPGDRDRYRISFSFMAAISGSLSSSPETSPSDPPSESIWASLSVFSSPPLALALVPGTALVLTESATWLGTAPVAEVISLVWPCIRLSPTPSLVPRSKGSSIVNDMAEVDGFYELVRERTLGVESK